MRRGGAVLLVLGVLAATELAGPPPAAAFNPLKPVCGAAGWVSGLVGKACNVAQHAGRVIQAAKQLAGGRIGGAAKALAGAGSSASSTLASHASTVIGLAAIGAWVLGGAKVALHETATVLSDTTTPQLRSTWFSSTYWRMAGIATVLTLPFLFAAAVQALMRSDLTLLARAALGYLPLAMLAVGIAAPVAMLLLVVSDQLSAFVSSAAGNASGHFLDFTSGVVGVLTVFSGSPFLAFLVGGFTAAAALALWLELLVREAAVYVIVLMLPLAFAALVWPARRVWAIRAVELLVALILSKFAIVAVLSLGGAAVSSSVSGHSITGAVAGGALVLMAAFAPWALLRLLPLAELAGGAAGSLKAEGLAGVAAATQSGASANRAENWLAAMRDQAEDASAMNGSPSGDGSAVNGTGSAAQITDEPSEARSNGDSFGLSGSPTGQLASDRPGGEEEHSSGEPPHADERLPGMDSIWQMQDGEWEPIVLGPDLATPAPETDEPDLRPPRDAGDRD
jgi:hypothetical protein